MIEAEKLLIFTTHEHPCVCLFIHIYRIWNLIQLTAELNKTRVKIRTRARDKKIGFSGFFVNVRSTDEELLLEISKTCSF